MVALLRGHGLRVPPPRLRCRRRQSSAVTARRHDGVPSGVAALRRARSTRARSVGAVRRARCCVIVNPYATTVSTGSRTSSSTRCRAATRSTRVDTQAPGHATELCREAAERGLRRRGRASAATARSTRPPTASPARDTPLTCCPGGSHERLREDARHPGRHRRRDRAPAAAWPTTGAPRRVDLGRVNEPLFTFSAGAGPRRERRRARRRAPAAEGPLRPVVLRRSAAVARSSRSYVVNPPRLARRGARQDGRRRHGDRPERRPLHVLRKRPIDVWRGHRRSTTATLVRRRARARAAGRHADDAGARLLADGLEVADHRRVERASPALDGCRRALGRRAAVPLQVDGDYIGRRDRGRAALRGRAAHALTVRRLSAQPRRRVTR